MNTRPSAANGPLQFQQEMRERFAVGLRVTPCAAGPERFRSEITAFTGGNLRFASLRFSPHTTSSAHFGSVPSRFLVSLHREGSALVQQDGRQAAIGPNDVFLIDPSRPFHIETDAIHVHSVYLEPEALRAAVPDIDSLVARRVDASRGAGAIFANFLLDLARQGSEIDEAEADHLADALPFLLAATLASLDRSGTQVSASRMRLHHKQRVLKYATDHLREGALDGARVAEGVCLSRRYVSELFADDGNSLMKWIWSERLQRCRRDLGNAAMAGRSIGEIAFHWGFNDLSHFSRSFKAAFGTPPRQYRATAQAARTSAAPAN